jgi:hypothetical protein
MSHLYQISLSCVIGHLMCHRRLPTTDFQSCWEGEGGWGQKVLSRPSADSFAVGRRQKEGGGEDDGQDFRPRFQRPHENTF